PAFEVVGEGTDVRRRLAVDLRQAEQVANHRVVLSILDARNLARHRETGGAVRRRDLFGVAAGRIAVVPAVSAARGVAGLAFVVLRGIGIVVAVVVLVVAALGAVSGSAGIRIGASGRQ